MVPNRATHHICIYVQYFFDAARKFLGCSEKSNFKQKMSTRVIKKKIKSSSTEYVRSSLDILTNEKHFPKTISQ